MAESGPESGGGIPMAGCLRQTPCSVQTARLMAGKGYKITHIVIGKGAYGTVYHGYRKGMFVACKVVDVERLVTIKGPHQRLLITKEIEISKVLIHQNVVKTFYTFELKTDNLLAKVYIFMELCERDLLSLVREKGGLLEDEAKKIFLGVCRGLEYMHFHPMRIYHGDIKPDNVLLDASGIPKLTDFTMSVNQSDPEKGLDRNTTQDICGTYAYLSPELLQGLEAFSGGRTPDEFDPMAADVYALAMTLYVTLENCHPFYSTFYSWITWQWIIDRQRKQKYTFKRPISAAGEKLLRAMSLFDPDMRPTMGQVVLDEWFQGMSDSSSSSASGSSTGGYATAASQLEDAEEDGDEEASIGLLKQRRGRKKGRGKRKRRGRK